MTMKNAKKKRMIEKKITRTVPESFVKLNHCVMRVRRVVDVPLSVLLLVETLRGVYAVRGLSVELAAAAAAAVALAEDEGGGTALKVGGSDGISSPSIEMRKRWRAAASSADGKLGSVCEENAATAATAPSSPALRSASASCGAIVYRLDVPARGV